MLTIHQLAAIMPQSTEENRKRFIEPLNKAMSEFRINTPSRRAAFLAQVAHESVSLGKVLESTFYSSADRLFALFPHDFKNKADASHYVKKPIECANRIYAKQNGNGSEASGDGWKYRGRGLIQITGRNNYAACGKGIDLDLIAQPELLERPIEACRSAAWFWASHGCNELADSGLFGAITKKINGGYNGAKERLAFYGMAKRALT
jgi:putative chitinase